MKLMMKACLVACVAGVSLFGGCGGEGESSSAPAAAKKPSVNAMAVKGGLVFNELGLGQP